MKTFGTPLSEPIEGQVILKPDDPGYFTISPETLRQIEEIDRNIACAKKRAPYIWSD